MRSVLNAMMELSGVRSSWLMLHTNLPHTPRAHWPCGVCRRPPDACRRRHCPPRSRLRDEAH